jgi:formylglycine-generating enzyme required for sulfatase activity
MKLNRKIIRIAVTAICVSTAATCWFKRTLAQEGSSTPHLASQEHEPPNQPENMVWIPSGEFTMGN